MRQARLLRLDPKYADVTVRRCQDWTGKLVFLDGIARTSAEIEVERTEN